MAAEKKSSAGCGDLVVIAEAEKALRELRLEDCRRIAAPIYVKYQNTGTPLTPELERLFGVFVAVGNGHHEALELLGEAPQEP